MAQQTAVDYLIEQLQAPCRGIPSHIIEQAKAMEKEQIMDSYGVGKNDGCSYMYDGKTEFKNAEQYYNETYGNRTENN